jgi:hypothetical protein
MSSLVGTGVADTVVFTVAVDTWPTKRSQYSSRFSVKAVENATGFATVDPFNSTDCVGVGMIVAEEKLPKVAFWEATSPR